MLKNYFKIAFRNLWRKRVFSFINIIGLAIGMASAALIILWIQNEMTYDRFHVKQDRLYEVYGNVRMDGGIESQLPSPQLLVPALKKDIPEIEEASRLTWDQTSLFTYKEKMLKPKKVKILIF